MKIYKFMDSKIESTIKFILPETVSETQASSIKIDPIKENLPALWRDIVAAASQTVDEMYTVTNFRVDKDTNTITITGNLFNAFNMMVERGILDSQIIQSLESDTEFNSCLELTNAESLSITETNNSFF